MGKSLSRDQRKSSKYTTREEGRKFKEIQQYSSLSVEPKPEKPKVKWRPRSEIEVE